MKNLITDPTVAQTQQHKYLTIFAMLWLTFLFVGIFTSLKTFELFGLVFYVAVIAYPLTYIFADIFTEVYGYRTTRKVIWTGFLCVGIASTLAYLYTLVPPSQYFTPIENDAFNLIFRASPFLALATIIGFWVGENVNSIILALLKIHTSGNKQGLRYVLSTFLGQTCEIIVGTSIVVLVANLFTFQEAFGTMISTVLFVTLWEIIALPVTYRVVGLIKRAEGLDVYDRGTNFNPFQVFK